MNYRGQNPNKTKINIKKGFWPLWYERQLQYIAFIPVKEIVYVNIYKAYKEKVEISIQTINKHIGIFTAKPL